MVTSKFLLAELTALVSGLREATTKAEKVVLEAKDIAEHARAMVDSVDKTGRQLMSGFLLMDQRQTKTESRVDELTVRVDQLENLGDPA
jgi:predicted house-cleaning NTP pyrophosphatase (Maf/HAM1 superfamily)